MRRVPDPTNLKTFKLTFDREAGAVILSAAYGYTIEPFERDNLVHMSNVALDRFAQAATPGKWMVDLIPMRKHLIKEKETFSIS